MSQCKPVLHTQLRGERVSSILAGFLEEAASGPEREAQNLQGREDRHAKGCAFVCWSCHARGTLGDFTERAQFRGLGFREQGVGWVAGLHGLWRGDLSRPDLGTPMVASCLRPRSLPCRASVSRLFP